MTVGIPLCLRSAAAWDALSGDERCGPSGEICWRRLLVTSGDSGGDSGSDCRRGDIFRSAAGAAAGWRSPVTVCLAATTAAAAGAAFPLTAGLRAASDPPPTDLCAAELTPFGGVCGGRWRWTDVCGSRRLWLLFL